MKHTYTKRDFHNPEQLTRQQVDAEFRLLLPEELDGRFCYTMNIQAQCVGTCREPELSWIRAEFASCSNNTYRIPLATPLPDGTVLSSNECCWVDEPQKPRCYVGGKMTGVPEYNFPAFFAASKFMEEQGYEAINPAKMDLHYGYTLEKLENLTPTEFQEFLKGAMKRDLDAIQGCDALVLLPGWESSKGARAEKAVAEWGGKRIGYLWSERGDGFRLTWEDEKQPLPYSSDERAEWDVEFQDGFLEATGAAKATRLHPNDPKGAAGAMKAPMQLLPPDALVEVSKAMGYGASRYGAWNFIEAQVCASTYIGAIGRHWASWAKGIDKDTDSGLDHMAHIAANCLIIMTAAQQGTLIDDRPKLK